MGSVTTISSQNPQIILIPWDPFSVEHVERLIRQRVACGWKQECVASWRKVQEKGEINIQWIVNIPLYHNLPCRILIPSGHPRFRSRKSLQTTQTCSNASPRKSTASRFRNFIRRKPPGYPITSENLHTCRSYLSRFPIGALSGCGLRPENRGILLDIRILHLTCASRKWIGNNRDGYCREFGDFGALVCKGSGFEHD